MSLFGFLKRDFDRIRRKEDLKQSQENAINSQNVDELDEINLDEQKDDDAKLSDEKKHFSFYIPQEEFDILCELVCNLPIQQQLQKIDWKNPDVETLALFMRNAVRDTCLIKSEYFKIRFLKYLVSLIIESYSSNNPVYYNRVNGRVENMDAFMHILIQALFDVCLIVEVDFYEVFMLIKNLGVYHNNCCNTNCIIEYKFDYSFSCFTRLWEECKSKFFMDKKDKYMEAIGDVINTNFNDFLSVAQSIDIMELYRFSIRNENVLKGSLDSIIFNAISDEEFDPDVFLSNDSEKEISRIYPSLCVASYINRLCSIVFSMCKAKEEKNDKLICKEEIAMKRIIQEIEDLIEYRSESFDEFFVNNWDFVLSSILNRFSGNVLNIYSDFIIREFKISKQEIEDMIISYVFGILISYQDGEKMDLDTNDIDDIRRLLTNKTVLKVVDFLNPAIISAL